MHLAKGEVVGFARPESSEVTYMATTNELNMAEVMDVTPRIWIPQRKWNLQSQGLQQLQATQSDFREHSRKSQRFPERQETEELRTARKDITSTLRESKHESGEHSQNSRWQSTKMGSDRPQNANDSARSANLEKILKTH